jgi:hypothetical protein
MGKSQGLVRTEGLDMMRILRLGDDRRGTTAQQAMCGSVLYRHAETDVPVTGHEASSELHRQPP